ncbi:MAG: glycosyltransferase [Halioglobus sp.]|nr:glycosyltransferase [Halioglobus sp.]
MFRVADRIPLVVVSPVAWFPFLGLVRKFRPGYRPLPPRHEVQEGVDVYYPRFFALPGIMRRLDGFFMALGARSTVKSLQSEFGVNVLDSHFAYPDGYAARLLARWLDLPFTVTLRGTEVRHCKEPALKKKVLQTLDSASRVITVANFLKDVVVAIGADGDKITRVGNGVDPEKFQPVDRVGARRRFNLAEDDTVLISVGGLVPRKGFHRVIEVLPVLIGKYPKLRYLIVGGGSPEGDFGAFLEKQVRTYGLQEHVRFLGAVSSADLKYPLSASDVFVLPTENEGWANVFLEAMACGLPVVTTRVGGNPEVVVDSALGTLVEFGNSAALSQAIDEALAGSWDRDDIRRYALENRWDSRVELLEGVFRDVVMENTQ